MASLNFYVRGNKHLHFKVLQIKINEKQTLLWVWRLYWKTGQGGNEYFFMVRKRASQWMPGYVKGMTLYSALTLAGQARPNNTNGKGQVIQVKKDFFISACYHLIRLLFTTETSKNLSNINLDFFLKLITLRICSLYLLLLHTVA